MSLWDASFSVPGTSTPPSETVEQHSPTLNDEVTEVFGQLERFWGGFRKQVSVRLKHDNLALILRLPPKGQTAIQAARKDLGDYVSQAQKGINKQLATLSVSAPVPAADADAQPTASTSTRDLADSITTDGGESSSTSSSASASTATLPDPQQQQQPQERAWSPTQTLFTRLQSSLPPDLLTTIRDTIPIPDSVRDPQARLDLAHAAQARVQGAAARGEELLRGASVLFRDAVRVVPPDPQTTASSSSTASHSRSASGSAPLGEAAAAASAVPATRRGALLRALRSNSAIIRVDPAGEERSAVLFATWVDAAGRDLVRDESRRGSELAADDGVLSSTLSTLGARLHTPFLTDCILVLMLIFLGIKYQGSYPRTCFGHGISSAYIRSTRKMNSGGPCSQVERPYISHPLTPLTAQTRSGPRGTR
jgi:hypothetical protein